MTNTNNKKLNLRQRIVGCLAGTAMGTGFVGFANPSTTLTRHLEYQPAQYSILDERIRISDYVVDKFVEKYKEEIMASARGYGVPPELIAATLKSENVGRNRFDDFKDFFGTLIGLNTSLGVGQINISIAKRFYKDITRETIVEKLLEPKENIDLMARFYADEIRTFHISGDELLDRPEVIAEVAARYVGGRRHKTEYAKNAGFNTLLYFTDESTFAPFGMRKDNFIRIAFKTKWYICSLPEMQRSSEIIEEETGYETNCSNPRTL